LRTGGSPSYSYSVTNCVAASILWWAKGAYEGGGGDVLRQKIGRERDMVISL